MKWIFQPVYLLLLIVLAAVYINRGQLFPGAEESLDAQRLVARVDGLVEQFRNGGSAPRDEAGDLPALTTLPRDDAQPPQEAMPTALPQDGAMDVIVAASDATTDLPPPFATAGVAEAAAPTTAALPEVSALPPADERSPVPDDASSAPVTVVTPLDASSELLADVASPLQQGEATALASVTDGERRADNAGGALPETGAAPAGVEAKGTERTAGDTLEVWREARHALWQGDVAASLAHYRQLIALQPDNYDAYGEMGNILLGQGEMEAAVEAYMQATRLIKHAGNDEVAWRLLQVIHRLSPQQARALYLELANN